MSHNDAAEFDGQRIEEGRQAFREGKKPSDNPYPRATYAEAMWSRGHCWEYFDALENSKKEE